MTHAGREPRPFSSQESMLAHEPSRPLAEQDTECTNKPYLLYQYMNTVV